VRLDVVRRQFAKIDDQWGEVEDLRRRGLPFERSWSSFCIFFPAGKGDLLASLRQRTPRSHVQTVSSPSQEGIWVFGAYYHLEMLLVAHAGAPGQ
jgi:hypothetical protein